MSAVGSRGTSGFHRARSGTVSLVLDADEVAVLRGLLEQLVEMVAPPEPADDDPLAVMVGIGTATSVPTDPVLARLFPDAYGEEEPAAAAEFRRYTETGLRERKRADATAALATLAGSGPRFRLDPEQQQAWLGALNDLRLALGTRLDVQEDWVSQLSELAPDDPAQVLFGLYDWLSVLQELLVRCLR